MRTIGPCWREERGATALTLLWATLAAPFFAFCLQAMLTVYIVHQQLRTAADAAALAATRAIVDLLPAAVEEEAEARVDRVLSDEEANRQIEEEIAELEAEQEACAADPLCVPLTPEEVEERIKAIKVRAYRQAFSRLFRGTLSYGMAEKIVEGTWGSTTPREKRDELIPDDGDLACLIRRTAHRHEARVLAEAERLARLNGAELKRAEVRLIDVDGQNYVEVSRKVKPVGAPWLFPDNNYPELAVEGKATLERVGHRTPDYSSGC
ncbi:MAG: hypothetical protein AB2385_16700 [Symbiobacterium sp.]|uniref:hypothetical protein n=1 Tax=Symbiobacterium sp. TaxID=1971213 RepID=UPI003463AA41